ncbi:MAG: hypothetical protein U0470_13425 [Anaerolineae bacterium]
MRRAGIRAGAIVGLSAAAIAAPWVAGRGVNPRAAFRAQPGWRLSVPLTSTTTVTPTMTADWMATALPKRGQRRRARRRRPPLVRSSCPPSADPTTSPTGWPTGSWRCSTAHPSAGGSSSGIGRPA